MANYVYNRILCTEEILKNYFLDYHPFNDKKTLSEPYITFNKLFDLKSISEYDEKYGTHIYYGYGVNYEKIGNNLYEIKFATKWLYPICAIIKAVELCREKLTWYACEESNVYVSKFSWKNDAVQEETLHIENEWNDYYEKYIIDTEEEYEDYDHWVWKFLDEYYKNNNWVLEDNKNLKEKYFDDYSSKRYYEDREKRLKKMTNEEIDELIKNETNIYIIMEYRKYKK